MSCKVTLFRPHSSNERLTSKFDPIEKWETLSNWLDKTPEDLYGNELGVGGFAMFGEFILLVTESD